MNEIILIKPTIEYSDDIMKYRQEFLDTNDYLAGCANLKDCLSAEEWLKNVDMLENENNCPPGYAPATIYIAVRLSDNKIVGTTDFRHHINHPVLGLWGGHIGYSVRAAERGKGYAKEMLRQNLQKCKDFGFDKILITCNPQNIASKKTILANGGQFEKEIDVDGKKHRRYWIYL